MQKSAEEICGVLDLLGAAGCLDSGRNAGAGVVCHVLGGRQAVPEGSWSRGNQSVGSGVCVSFRSG